MSDMLSQKHINNDLELLTIDGYRKVDKIVDYSTTCDEKIAAAKILAAKGKFEAAIEILLTFEMQTRVGNDVESTRRVLVSVVQLCFDAKEWELLNEHLIWLNKRRSQFVDAVTAMVKKCMTFIERTPNEGTKRRLIQTIKIVTRGLHRHLKLELEHLTEQLLQLKNDKTK